MKVGTTTAILLGILSLSGFLHGCGMATPGLADFETGQHRVALYVYPPAGSTLPAQVLTDLQLEANTSDVVELDMGITVAGQLMLSQLEGAGDDDDAHSQVVLASVTATSVDAPISYDAQVNVADSTFELRVPSGTYDIAISDSSSSLHIPPQRFRNVSISSLNNGALNLGPIDPGLPLTVTLNYKEGLPVAGASVFTLDDSGAIASTLISAVDGVYTLQISRASTSLWMGPDPEINPPLLNTRLGDISIDETLEDHTYIYDVPSARLEGTVESSDLTPVSDVIVYATRLPDGSDTLEGTFQGHALTDSSGRFTLEVPQGIYALLLRPTGENATSGTGLSGLKFSSTINVTQNLNIGTVVLPEMSTVELEVRGPDGSLVPGAPLTLVSSDQANSGTSDFTDDNGRCTLSLGVGAYLLEVTPPAGSDYTYLVQPIAVTPGTNVLDTVELEQGFEASVQFLAASVPLPGAIVQVWEIPEDGSPFDSPVYLLAAAVTDEQGNARLLLPQN